MDPSFVGKRPGTYAHQKNEVAVLHERCVVWGRRYVDVGVD